MADTNTKQALKKVDPRITTIKQYLEVASPKIKAVIPKHMEPEKMLRIALANISNSSKLLECSPASLLNAVIQSSQLGLEIGGLLGQAYLVPFDTKDGKCCQLIPGYKGLLKLARNSGELSTIQAHAVHEKDRFEFGYGLEPFLTHIPELDDSGEVIAFYAMARLKDGGSQFEIMSRKQVDKIRATSAAKNGDAWTKNYEEMGKKTVIRRLCKMLPASVELARAVALDERADAGLSQDIDNVFDLEIEPETGGEEKKASTLDKIVDAAETKKPETKPAVSQPTDRKPEAKPEAEPPNGLPAEDIEYLRQAGTEGESELFSGGDPFKG